MKLLDKFLSLCFRTFMLDLLQTMLDLLQTIYARPFTDYAWHCELKEAMAGWIFKEY